MPKISDYYQLISSLAMILDRDGDEKLNHSLRTAILANNLAQKVIPEESNIIFYAGLLHDVGGVGLPHNIVHYGLEMKLNEPRVREHPTKGADIVAQLPGMKKAARYIVEHHERWDGRGFPNGLKGEDLSLGGQILMLADQIELKIRAFAGNRARVYNFFRREKGKMFNDELWPVFLDIIGTRHYGLFYQLIPDYNLYKMAEEIEMGLPLLEFDQSEDYILNAVQVFGQVIDAKHPYTRGHSKRVAEYSAIIAKHLGLSKEEIREIRLAGYLHDMGKVAIPLSILDKKGKLTEEEYRQIKSHVVISMEFLEYEPFLRHLAPVAGSHHEKWDGTGYPDGLKGEEIPVGGRILGLVDSLDAVSSQRSYNEPVTLAEGIKKFEKARGKHFDPEIYDLVCKKEVIEELCEAKKSL